MPGLLDGTETVGIKKEVGRSFRPPRLERPRADSERGGDGDAGGDGMKIEIDIDEYFTPEMIKEIAEDELRGAFRRQFQKDFGRGNVQD